MSRPAWNVKKSWILMVCHDISTNLFLFSFYFTWDLIDFNYLKKNLAREQLFGDNFVFKFLIHGTNSIRIAQYLNHCW